MNLTVILPHTNRDLSNRIKKQLTKDDEFISFRSTSKTLRDDLNRHIVSASNDNIVLWNPKDEDRINVNKYRIRGNLVSNAKTSSKKKISINSTIKFHRSVFEPVRSNVKNLVDYTRKLLMNIDLHKVESTEATVIPEEIVKKERPSEQEDKIVSVVDNEKKRNSKFKNRKPRIIFVCDVKGWAWWIKTNYLKKYLEPYYDIDIVNLLEDGKRVEYNKYDLCFTYGYYFISKIRNVNIKKRITGITAHRPLSLIKPKMKLAGATHANSLLLYKELKKIHDNTFYVPNGVDSELFHSKVPLLDNGEMVFGHVGKLSPRKGQKEFIEPAVKKAKVQYFSHYNNYKNRIPHTSMVDVHQKYDVFIVASEEDGTPCPGLEAAACGRPIISNKIGNMPELVKDGKTGILLDKKDVNLYVDAIKWCRDNPDKVVEMGRNIRKKIEEEWTWELMAKNYLFMFDNILGIERMPVVYENPSINHLRK